MQVKPMLWQASRVRSAKPCDVIPQGGTHAGMKAVMSGCSISLARTARPSTTLVYDQS